MKADFNLVPEMPDNAGEFPARGSLPKDDSCGMKHDQFTADL